MIQFLLQLFEKFPHSFFFKLSFSAPLFLTLLESTYCIENICDFLLSVEIAVWDRVLYDAQAGMDSQSSWLSLLGAEIAGVCSDTWDEFLTWFLFYVYR